MCLADNRKARSSKIHPTLVSSLAIINDFLYYLQLTQARPIHRHYFPHTTYILLNNFIATNRPIYDWVNKAGKDGKGAITVGPIVILVVLNFTVKTSKRIGKNWRGKSTKKRTLFSISYFTSSILQVTPASKKCMDADFNWVYFRRVLYQKHPRVGSWYGVVIEHSHR